MSTERDRYDAVAYPAFAYPDTHPDRLASMATLHGLSPAPVDGCRVLEVACGEGANLIPMAYAAPASDFVGFDLARLPIERGQARIRELGVRNIRIFQGNLLDAGKDLGNFDYIIAHGLFAWVPEPVRDRLLELCRKLLTPHGVAFISYNALPGGHLRRMIREMMLFHVNGIEDASEKAAKAIEFMRFLAGARAQDDSFRMMIEEQLRQMEKRSPQAIFHDELSEINEPLLFSEFAAHATRHGLQYLSEAVLPPPPDPCYGTDLQAALEDTTGDDFIAREQVLDFMRMRMYRETLLCHAGREVRRDFSADAFKRLLFVTQASLAIGGGSGTKVFVLPGGIRMETDHAGTVALMELLSSAWPHALSWSEIESALSPGAVFLFDHDEATLLMRLVVAKMIELHAWKAPVASGISERPRASASARQEARRGTHVTTLLHTTARFEDPVVRSFLLLLDGTRDRAGLLQSLKDEYPNMLPDQIEQGIESNLRMFYRAGVLEA